MEFIYGLMLKGGSIDFVNDKPELCRTYKLRRGNEEDFKRCAEEAYGLRGKRLNKILYYLRKTTKSLKHPNTVIHEIRNKEF